MFTISTLCMLLLLVVRPRTIGVLFVEGIANQKALVGILAYTGLYAHYVQSITMHNLLVLTFTKTNHT